MFLEKLNSLNIQTSSNESVVLWGDLDCKEPKFGFEAPLEVVKQPSLNYKRVHSFVFELISEN